MQSQYFSTFGKSGFSLEKQLRSPYADAFHKYSDGLMTKQEFKLAFIYLFGVKPSKDDLAVVVEYLSQTSHQSDFQLNEE